MAHRRSSLLFYFVIFIIYNEASALSILKSDTFKEDDTITVECSAEAIELEQIRDQVGIITLSRKTYSNDKELEIVFLSSVELAFDENSPDYKRETIPNRRQWEIELPPKQDLLNTATRFKRSVVKTKLTIKDATCSDSGLYFCSVTYLANDFQPVPVKKHQELNGTVVASQIRIQIEPDNSNTMEIEAEYSVNDTIRMTCNVEAPEDYNFYWKRRCPNRNTNFVLTPRFVRYPVQNDIKEHKKEAVPNNQCGVYKHSQTLEFQMSDEMEDCMLRCEFGERDGNLDNMMANFTFLLRTPASALSILKSDTFKEDDTITVECSAEAIELEQIRDQVGIITLSRKTYSNDKELEIVFLSSVELAFDENSPDYKRETIPNRRQWEIELPPKQDLINTATRFKRSVVKTKLTIKDATCSDSGLYFCSVSYLADGFQQGLVKKHQELNGTVVASQIRIQIEPDNSNTREIEAEYSVNDTIKMTCNVEAPEDYNFYWKRRCPNRNTNFVLTPRFVRYPVQNDIKEHKKEAVPNNQCGVYKHSQTLEFQMSDEMEDCMLRCEFGERDGNLDNMMANFTFLLRTPASALSILKSDTFKKDDTITVECSAEAIELEQIRDQVGIIQLSRKTYSSNSDQEMEIVFLSSLALAVDENSPDYKRETIPNRRQWEIELPPKQDLINTATRFKRSVVKTKLTIKDATCSDSGLYFCSVSYLANDFQLVPVKKHQELNGTVVASQIRIQIEPDNSNTREIEAEYSVNDTIKMTCNVEAPEDYNFYWKRRCPNRNTNFVLTPRFVRYPVQNDIKEHKKEAVPNNQCGVYKHSQTLEFQMSDEMEDCMLRCEFGERDGNLDNMMANFTFLLRTPASALSILKSDTFKEGDTITVECSAEAIELEQIRDRVGIITLSRKTYSKDKEEEIVFLSSLALAVDENSPDYKRETIPNRRQWEIELPPKQDLLNTATRLKRSVVKTKLTIKDATCSDSGLYFCSVSYLADGFQQVPVKKHQELNGTDLNNITTRMSLCIPLIVLEALACLYHGN